MQQDDWSIMVFWRGLKISHNLPACFSPINTRRSDSREDLTFDFHSVAKIFVCYNLRFVPLVDDSNIFILRGKMFVVAFFAIFTIVQTVFGDFQGVSDFLELGIVKSDKIVSSLNRNSSVGSITIQRSQRT